MIMHGFQKESVVKNLSGVKEFIKIPVDKNKTSIVNKDVDFSEISEKISKMIERSYEDMHNKDIFFAARKNIKLMPADFDTMPAMPNFGDEYADECEGKCWTNEQTRCYTEVWRCEYMGYTDYDQDSLLWDGCKECGVHMPKEW